MKTNPIVPVPVPARTQATRPAAKTSAPAPTPALFSPENAARYLDVSRAQVYRWLAAGRLAGFRVGRRRHFTRAELDAFAEELAAEGQAS